MRSVLDPLGAFDRVRFPRRIPGPLPNHRTHFRQERRQDTYPSPHVSLAQAASNAAFHRVVRQ
jgi:hypothetical protein